MMTHTYNPSTCEVEAGGSGIQSQPWIHNTLEASLGYMKLCQWTKGGRDRGKKKKRKKPAPIHTSSHVSKIHVLWLKSQEPGYYAKKACILEPHQLESSEQVKTMCPPVMNDNLRPKGCSQGKYLWHLHSFSGLWSNGTLLGWEPWLHGYCREHSDYETMRRRKSPWQTLFLSLISTVNDTHAPVDSFMLINKFK